MRRRTYLVKGLKNYGLGYLFDNILLFDATMTQDTDLASHSILAGRLSEKSGLVFRSNAAAAEIESGSDSSSPDAMEADDVFTAIDTNGADDEKDDDDDNVVDDAITLPQSTHTLLFTEPIISRAFLQSVFIAGLSILCLLLALMNTEGAKLAGIKRSSLPMFHRQSK